MFLTLKCCLGGGGVGDDDRERVDHGDDQSAGRHGEVRHQPRQLLQPGHARTAGGGSHRCHHPRQTGADMWAQYFAIISYLILSNLSFKKFL